MTERHRELFLREAQGTVHWSKVPHHTQQALLKYLEHHILPGDFLRAVLQNNLTEAVLFADKQNQEALQDIIRVLYNYAPSPSWGSETAVREWIT